MLRQWCTAWHITVRAVSFTTTRSRGLLGSSRLTDFLRMWSTAAVRVCSGVFLLMSVVSLRAHLCVLTFLWASRVLTESEEASFAIIETVTKFLWVLCEGNGYKSSTKRQRGPISRGYFSWRHPLPYFSAIHLHPSRPCWFPGACQDRNPDTASWCRAGRTLGLCWLGEATPALLSAEWTRQQMNHVVIEQEACSIDTVVFAREERSIFTSNVDRPSSSLRASASLSLLSPSKKKYGFTPPDPPNSTHDHDRVRAPSTECLTCQCGVSTAPTNACSRHQPLTIRSTIAAERISRSPPNAPQAPPHHKKRTLPYWPHHTSQFAQSPGKKHGITYPDAGYNTYPTGFRAEHHPACTRRRSSRLAFPLNVQAHTTSMCPRHVWCPRWW